MIPRIPLSAPDIGEAEIAAVTAVLRRSQLSLGPELAAFEEEFAAFHNVPEAVAVSSGTAGLHLSLLVLGLGPGDEIIIPSFTFVAVANAIWQIGATPVFADIDPHTLNLDPTKVEAQITPQTRAIVVVHTFGIPADMDAFLEISNRHNLRLIEDACEAIGAQYRGRPVGTFGDAAVFGFYPNKQMTTGEGGAVLVRNPAHAKRLRSLRNQGRTPDTDWLDHAEPGYNYRLSELACALGRTQLHRLHELIAQRQRAAARYHSLLEGIEEVHRPPLEIPDVMISWFVYVVRLAPGVSRDNIQRKMAQQGIATGRYFPAIHAQPAWKSRIGENHIELPVTDSIAPHTLALPFFNRITEIQQQEVVTALKIAIDSEIS